MSEVNPPEVAQEPVRPVWVHHLVTVFVWAFVLALFIYFFKAVRLVGLGFLAAACLGCTMRPLMKHVPGNRWTKAIVVGVLPLLVSVGLITLLGWLMAGSIQKQFSRWPQVRQNINQWLGGLSQRMGLDDQLTVQGILSRISDFVTGQGADVYSATASFASTVLIVLVFIYIGCIYFLGMPEDRLLNPILRMLPAHRRPQVHAAVDDLDARLRWWFIGTLISMIVVGIAAGIGYTIIGLELAIPLAVLAGLAEIVPTVGPAVAFLIAALFAATQGTGTLFGVVVIYAIVQALESYILLPYIMKRAVHIPPLLTLFTVVLWGQIFGAGGLLLAIPIDLVIWSFADHLLTRPRPPS